jgi:hypothetical protein
VPNLEVRPLADAAQDEQGDLLRQRVHHRRRRTGCRIGAAELPGADHERGHRGDAHEREQDDLALEPAVVVHARAPLRRLVEAVAPVA